jgi:predicted ester cyclase
VSGTLSDVSGVKANEAMVREFMERAFNRGELAAIDELVTADGIDHQEPPGTDFRKHLKQVITSMRTALPDLHFEIHDMISQGDIVAFRSTMTGTQTGPLAMGPGRQLPPSGRRISVPHLHWLRVVDGLGAELWHQWDIPGMLRQLGAGPTNG